MLLVLVAAGGLETTAAAPGAAAPDAQRPTFEAFKKLVGEWVGAGAGDEQLRVTYKLTAGGSALVETELPGSDHEMVTIIHPDGDDVVLTHYCHLGNQPQMRAPGKFDGKQVAFKFVRATNLKSEQDMHMRSVTYTFVDDDTLKAEWTVHQGGKPGGTAIFLMKRKK
jgi:hypothetical protein